MINRHVWQRWWRYKRYLNIANLPAHDVACPCCGIQVSLPSLGQTQRADCPQCGQLLVKIQSNPFVAPLAFVTAGWILMLLVGTQFYLGMDMMGVVSEHLSLIDVFDNLRRHEYGFLATVMLLLVFFTPVLFLSMFMYVHIALYRQVKLPFLNTVTRHMIRIKPWLMVDVFFIATLVSIVKIAAISEVSFGPAFVLIFAYAVILIHMGQMVNPHWLFYQLAKLDPEHKVFEHIKHKHHCISCTRCLYDQPATQDECDICGASLYQRRPYSIQQSLAILIAACILFIPSNIYTMMRTESLTADVQSNVIDGIFILWNENDRLVAVIIFVASLMIPVAKIIMMGILLYSAKYKLLLPAKILSKMYHFVEFIGRWSMIDIFVIIILMAMYRTNVAQVTPGLASIYFTFVVFATMVSAELLDIRLIWDKQRQLPVAGEQHERA